MTDPAITCPFCGLACDDLAVSRGAVDTRGCALAAMGFARSAAPRQPHRVAGAEADLPRALADAAALLKGAKAPLFHGLTADLHGQRAVLALAERTGGAVDHRNSAAVLANTAVARASGWVTATFAEIANRADAILVLAADPALSFPRFHERLLHNAKPLYRGRVPELAYIGPAASVPAEAAEELRALITGEDMLPALGALAALVRRRRVARLPSLALPMIAERLRAARYGAVVWDTSLFPPGEAELAVELLADLLRHLNAETRCVGLPLGGSGNALGGQLSALWQTGWPLPVEFAAGTPRHDPWRAGARRRLAAGEADLLVWVSLLQPEPPPECGIPVIAILADDIVLPRPAAVELRVGVPGLDHAGAVIRSDAIVALPLQAALPSDRPSLAEIAERLLAVLEAASC